ncbi:MAG TPA: hypothetical protein VK387_02160 [Thermoleophilaceae bacterium]|nr:hypothetical protein [Thermoleophilaceae bacterium]
MAFELVGAPDGLWLEGHSGGDEIGDYNGRVIAIAMRDTDPLSAAQPEHASTPTTEGLLGWGTTYFLVCDPNRDAPVWVAKESITSHRFEDA